MTRTERNSAIRERFFALGVEQRAVFIGSLTAGLIDRSLQEELERCLDAAEAAEGEIARLGSGGAA